MTVQDVLQRVKDIAAKADDDEVAHSDEDDLHQDVLRAISDGAEDAAGLAKAALKTKQISFARWCA